MKFKKEPSLSAMDQYIFRQFLHATSFSFLQISKKEFPSIAFWTV